MNGQLRREKIIDILSRSDTPVSGVALANQLNVSRQVIVQDIALIRAASYDVYSTNRGYVIRGNKEYTRIVKVKHTNADVEKELNAIVDMGGWVKDVFVYHKVYGVVKAELNIHSRRDIKAYMEEINNGSSTLLMNVTSGYHYHTIAAQDESTLDIIQEELERLGFLAKLQENMKLAQGEFKELNKALKGIDFSSERYEFQFMPSKKYRSYYEMIMDDFNVIQGESLFSGMFHEAHKDVIEELFERLSVGGENSTQTLEEFTDYRTYMDYDIKIIHDDGTYSYYSKVCEEKSGGETQTPFYVTVAASFVQLYSNNIGGEAAGLVLFDEAFNNMDDERIGGVLEFLRRLPLQLIIAAPPDKIQYIGPAMDEIMLVMTDQKRSYVEEYHNAV